MTPDQWRQVDTLFHRALELPKDERARWLEAEASGNPEVLAEVRSLLESDHAGAGFGVNHLEPAVASLLVGKTPVRVGPYRLVRELGQGGMGMVYLAERDDEQYKTEVAIKLVRRGLDTDLILHRFYRERQALARLQHPNIARLLDGSTTEDGLPYIVMEYVEGSRITDYCREHGLNVAQRLTLFLDVCKAVDYAHRQFVVHRDIKPGNILVNQAGEVKLLDFGICKLLQTQPQYGDQTVENTPAPLTPDYASPEQIQGAPITVASDVYSAAAVLYELLTGARPHQIESYTIRGIERGICETEIVRPSLAADRALARQLRGDLDNILLHALQKDPNRRYPSIASFADDIRRYLDYRPVHARPDTLAYRAGKFVRRRRGLVAALAAIILAVTAGLVSTARSARIANENLRLVRQLSNTFVFDVYDSVRDLPGSTNARQLIVRTGLQYLDNLSRNAAGDLELQRELAAAYRRIGDVQGDVLGANLGNTGEALKSYEKALSLLEAVLKSDPPHREAQIERITVHQRIGALRSYTRDSAQALASYTTASELAGRLFTRRPDDEEVGRLLADLENSAADVRRRSGDYAAARRNYVRALELLTPYEKSHPDDRRLQRSISETYSGIATCDVRLGRLKEALEGHREGTARMERLLAQDPANASYQRDLMFKYSHIGDVLGNPNLRSLGDTAGAAQAYGRTVELARKLHEADPADQRARADYGIALARVGAVLPASDPQARIATFRQALRLLEEVVRANPENVISRIEISAIHNFLGDSYLAAGQAGEAARAFSTGIEVAQPLLSSGSGTVVTGSLFMCRKLGELLARRGDREQSLSLARRALELSSPEGPAAAKRPPDLQRILTPRGFAAMGLVQATLARSAAGRPADRAEARNWLEQSLAAYRELEKHPSFSDLHRRELLVVEKALETLQ